MSLTSALAIWGAITGTLAAFLTWLPYHRDRVKLLVRGSPYSRGDPRRPWFRTYVVNEGRQPVMITMLIILSRQPFRLRMRLRFLSLRSDLLLPLVVRDRQERMQRMKALGKSITPYLRK